MYWVILSGHGVRHNAHALETVQAAVEGRQAGVCTLISGGMSAWEPRLGTLLDAGMHKQRV